MAKDSDQELTLERALFEEVVLLCSTLGGDGVESEGGTGCLTAIVHLWSRLVCGLSCPGPRVSTQPQGSPTADSV
jgi:hypothetical protein